MIPNQVLIHIEEIGQWIFSYKEVWKILNLWISWGQVYENNSNTLGKEHPWEKKILQLKGSYSN